MFKLPVFDEKHHRFKKSMEHSIHSGGYPDWKYKSQIVLDDDLPEGFVYNRSFNANYELNDSLNKVTDDIKCNIVVDLTNKKSVFNRNRKFNKVVWTAPSFIFDEKTVKPFKETYFLEEYGVADSPEQVYAHYKFLEDDLNSNYFVSLTPIYKEHQEKSGSFRFHKWGPYIGNQKPTREYLYQEPHIDLLFVYYVYKFKNVTPDIITEHFNFIKNGGGSYQVFDRSNNIAFCTVCFKDKEVITWSHNNHIDLVLGTFDDTISPDNIGVWFEANYKDDWL